MFVKWLAEFNKKMRFKRVACLSFRACEESHERGARDNKTENPLHPSFRAKSRNQGEPPQSGKALLAIMHFHPERSE